MAGKVLDGEGTGEKNYTVRVYYPVSGTFAYDEITTPSTVTTGTYSLPIETGSGKGYGAGVWYVGTYATPGTRVDMSHEPPYVAGFIPYYSFTVGTKDTATVTVHNTDDLVKGFTQTVNVSVKNETWMTGNNKEFQNMKIHVTGIKGYYGGREYGRTDVALVTATKKGTSDTRQYYEFDYMFNETGTATIWVSWPGNSTKYDYHGSSYGNRFGNHSTSLIANITGSTTVSVVSPGAMTVLVDNVPEAVEKEAAACGGGWVNKSTAWTNISVYGSTENSHKNATITVTGCGLSFTIKESDTIAGNKYLIDKGHDDNGNGAWYNISIIPKMAGTLTITVTNGSNEVVKDYSVTGLTGSVSTSIGDDLKIIVGTTETITLSGVSEYAETKITFFDEDWDCQALLNASEAVGEFSFTPDADDIDRIGYIVVVAGITAWDMYMYDIIEVVAVDDLTVNVTTPDEGNQTLTVGLEQEIVVKLLDSDGNAVTEDSPAVIAKLIDEDNDEDDPLQEFTFTSIGDGEWEATLQPWFAGQLVITGYNASTGIKHIGNTTLDVDYATITYSPAGTTAAIGIENLTVNVSGVDANGNPLSGVTLYLWNGSIDGATLLVFDDKVTLDEDGVGEFDIAIVGDNKTTINATLDNNQPADGNRTLGVFSINFPTFTVDPATIYIGKSNLISIIAKDYAGAPLEDVWLTLTPTYGNIAAEPDPVKTDSDGEVLFSINPSSSGTINVTIVKDIDDRTKDVTTDTYITVTHLKELTITFSKSPIYEGETLTVTVTTGTSPVENVGVTFAGDTKMTGSDGKQTFVVPDPGVDSAIYDVTAEKAGYVTATKSITVINKWDISIVPPSGKLETGKSYTFTVVAKGQPLAGATVAFNDKTYTSGGDGKVTLTMPETKGDYTITATYTNYMDATETITVVKAETPGFELLTLVIALGVAFILLKRRRKQ
ncbi:MAG TPA: hypothetical protein ENN45_04545 [Bacteroidetes bacterium]|nr:hypothetical protein [Bacteroidota bacterium]